MGNNNYTLLRLQIVSFSLSYPKLSKCACLFAYRKCKTSTAAMAAALTGCLYSFSVPLALPSIFSPPSLSSYFFFQRTHRFLRCVCASVLQLQFPFPLQWLLGYGKSKIKYIQIIFCFQVS